MAQVFAAKAVFDIAMHREYKGVCQFFRDQMFSVLPIADIVFSNKTEAAIYAEQLDNHRISWTDAITAARRGNSILPGLGKSGKIWNI